MAETKNKISEDEIKKLISEIAEIEPQDIKPTSSFVEDLGMDSMMALEILASLEKKYKIKIPEENLAKMTNLKQVMELVNSLIK